METLKLGLILIDGIMKICASIPISDCVQCYKLLSLGHKVVYIFIDLVKVL